ncbi:WXG100 family type VII secretion target [Paenibacillus sp. KS-LC4]|uniref:WXG100 family type VII secretion target n=1 Tax=Paenibacillus sp. KS-LC4 TaxID=2979727 RepID=UPI0030CAB345
MVTSMQVSGYSTQCTELIRSAQACSSEMSQSIKGMTSYWNEMGQAQFAAECQGWIKAMNEVQRQLSQVQTSLNQYASQLKQEELAKEREAARQREQEAAAKNAAKTTTTVRTK